MIERDQAPLPDFLPADSTADAAGESPGRTRASSGAAFEREVARIIEDLGLSYLRQVSMGVSVLGRRRVTDFLVYDHQGRSLGIECKYQAVSGSAEDKLVHTINDFDARPVKHILVFGGEGFSKNVSGYLLSTGKAIPLEDLRAYLVFYFALEDYYAEFGKP